MFLIPFLSVGKPIYYCRNFTLTIREVTKNCKNLTVLEIEYPQAANCPELRNEIERLQGVIFANQDCRIELVYCCAKYPFFVTPTCARLADKRFNSQVIQGKTHEGRVGMVFI